MGKNKKGAPSAAEQAAAKQAAPAEKPAKQETKKTEVKVVQLGDLEKLVNSRSVGSLDANHTADVLTGMRKMFFENKEAAKDFNIPQDSIGEINRITAMGHVALFATCVVMDQTPFAAAMRKNELEAILEAAEKMGVNINEKLLPAPDADGKIALPVDAEVISVDEKTKEKIKKEQAVAAEKIELDPTKIENEEHLKKALLQILVKGNGSDNIYDKLSTAVNFYEAYLGIQAGKSDDADAARAALKQKTRSELLSEIASTVGECTFALTGVAKFMFEHTERTKSPVVAFCQLRDASLNKKTGMPQIEDQMVADITKVLIRWYADTEIAASNKVIAGFERDIETLKKDPKKNAKGIEDGNKKIANAKKHIEDVEKVVTYANMPDRSTVDNFAKDYVDNKAEGFKMARMIGSKIAKTYYGNIAIKDVKQESLVHNLQQYMGVITNMFLPAMHAITDYSEANITELEMLPAEEKAAEEKNA